MIVVRRVRIVRIKPNVKNLDDMAINRGKQFEHLIKETLNSLPGVLCERLYDNTSGFIGINTPSDFIVYKYPYIYFVECKTIHGASIPIQNLVQIDRIADRCVCEGVKGVFLIWFVDKQQTYAVDYSILQLLRNSGAKSINYTSLQDISKTNSKVKLIPAQYKRILGKYDLTILFEE